MASRPENEDTLHRVVSFLLGGVWQKVASPVAKRTDLFDLPELHQARMNARVFGLYKTRNPEDFPDLGAGHIPSYRLENGSYVPQLKTPVVASALKPDTALAFQQDVQRAIGDLPVGVRQLFTEKGTEFVMGRRLVEITPGLADKMAVAREGMGYEHTSAYYGSAENHLAIAQEYRHQFNDEYLEDDNPYHAVLHEAGHGVDAMVNITGFFDAVMFSTKGREPVSDYGHAFSEAYLADIQKLSETQQTVDNNLRYYLPVSHGGMHEDAMDARAELVAELFAERVDGGGIGPLHQAFPQSARVLERIMASLEREFERHPDMGRIPQQEMYPSVQAPTLGFAPRQRGGL